MNKQGTVNTDGLNEEQLKFTVSVLASLLDNIIQDCLVLNDDGTPAPINEQHDPLIKNAMANLNYKVSK